MNNYESDELTKTKEAVIRIEKKLKIIFTLLVLESNHSEKIKLLEAWNLIENPERKG